MPGQSYSTWSLTLCQTSTSKTSVLSQYKPLCIVIERNNVEFSSISMHEVTKKNPQCSSVVCLAAITLEITILNDTFISIKNLFLMLSFKTPQTSQTLNILNSQLQP